MKRLFQYFFLIVFLLNLNKMIYPNNFIPANNPNINYYGRWDMTDSLNPKHSWPGIYIVAGFCGTSIGVRMNDNINYYNVYIDGRFFGIFHGSNESEADYILAGSLTNTNHILRFSQRNISFGIYSFSGFLLDDGAVLLPPRAEPSRKIEFIGDSFTAAEGNEATQLEMEWNAKFPVTNIDEGFASIIAGHYNAQYHTTCRSGIGMVCDWQGKFDISMPRYYDRTLMERAGPKWDFEKWIPDLVVICLGINDYSGLKEDEHVSEKNSEIFRKGYHDFLKTVRIVYPGVSILAVAADAEWIRGNVRQVIKKKLLKVIIKFITLNLIISLAVMLPMDIRMSKRTKK
jgi:hypothetical protein